MSSHTSRRGFLARIAGLAAIAVAPAKLPAPVEEVAEEPAHVPPMLSTISIPMTHDMIEEADMYRKAFAEYMDEREAS